MTRTFLFTSLFYIITQLTILSQESTGRLEGKLLDSKNNAIPLASITVNSPSMQGKRNVVSTMNGYINVLGLPVGVYDIMISHVSKQSLILKDVAVKLGKTTSLGEITLNDKMNEISEVVIFSGKPVIDLSSASSGLSLDHKVYETLPVERNYKSVMALSPLSTESFYGDGINVSGGTGWENTYYIDGTNVTDPMRGASGTNLPYNFIKEIEIKNGGYEAEYSGALGGIANVITYSGGNKLHGQVFGFFTDQRFAGDYKLGTVKKRIKDFGTYDFGLSFGGSIIIDKLWYYVAYNPTFEDQDVEIPGLGTYKDRKRSHRFAGKLSWQLSPKTNMVLTILGDPTKHETVESQYSLTVPVIKSAGNADPYLGEIKTGGYNISLKVQHIFNNNFYLESSVSGLETYYNNIAATDRGRSEPFYMDFVDEVYYVEGGYGWHKRNHGNRIFASINATYILNSHVLKAGLAYEDNFVDDRTFNKAGLNDELPSPILRFPTTFGPIYQAWWAEKDVRVHNRVPSFFLQDSWRVTERLQINAGLRWDGQFLVGSDGKVAQRITNQWQPRIGLAYQPDEFGGQKIFGSFGRFYEQLPLILTSTYFSNDLNIKNTYIIDPRNNSEPVETKNVSTSIQPEVPGLQGQHIDEFTLGYERRIGEDFRAGIKGIYRKLREVVEDAENDNGIEIMGNPGKGDLNFLPNFSREYSALEITFQKPRGRYNFLVSYTLSRNYGNYPGVFDSDLIYPEANVGNLNLPIQLINATGLLPNDRTHVFKIMGSYNFDFGLSLGTSFFLTSGTPLNEYGPVPGDPSNIIFHAKRGSAGRTPTIWDCNIRLGYDFGSITRSFTRFRILVDVFHVFSRREAILLQQHKYNSDDGEGFLLENPEYLQPEIYQPPMTIRLGVEVNF